MIQDPDLECNLCGADLKFTAPCRKNGFWFCSRVCEISANLENLRGILKKRRKIIDNQVVPSIYLKESISPLEDNFLM